MKLLPSLLLSTGLMAFLASSLQSRALAAGEPVLFLGCADNSAADLVKGSQPTNLTAGKLFVSAKSDINFQTPFGSVSAKRGARFLIDVEHDSLRIFSCRGHRKLSYRYANKICKVNVGQELCVFDHRPTEGEVLPADGVGRKQVKLDDLDGQKMTVAYSTFSLVSLLKSPNFLGGSHGHTYLNPSIKRDMVKSAAVLSVISPSSEDFYVTPSRHTLERLQVPPN